MKRISAIIGHRIRCNHCGAPCQLVMLPAVGERWQVCEQVTSATDVVELHDCPKHPSKQKVQV